MKSLNQVSGAHWLCGVCIETKHLRCFLPHGEGICFTPSAESNANPIQKHPHRHAQKNNEPNIPVPLAHQVEASQRDQGLGSNPHPTAPLPCDAGEF